MIEILIRPYTVSQVGVLMLIGFLLIYFYGHLQQRSPQCSPQQEDRATPWIMNALIFGGVGVAINMIAGMAESVLVDLVAYLRTLCSGLLAYALARAFYALPPVEPFVEGREVREWLWAINLFVLFEIAYFAYRFWLFWAQDFVAERPILLSVPIALLYGWTFLLVWRKWWATESATGLGPVHHLYRMLVAPSNETSIFYRLFSLIVLSLIFVMVIFIFVTAPPIPLGVMIGLDLLVLGSLFIAAYIYMRYRFVFSGLEIRIVGAGLVIFLGLASVLGWVISVSYLAHADSNANIYVVVGSQFHLQFTALPAYQAEAATLSRLLLPLIWFEVAGSLVFALLFTTFYRRTLKVTLHGIIGGFEQIQRGNLDYRIPLLPWDDEFSRIVVSFNRMAYSLEHSYDEVQTYQAHLEDLVTQRTTQLAHEIEVRKNLEVRQGIQAERARIARETHDGLLQTLLGLRIRLNRGPRLSRQEASIIEHELLDLSAEVTQAAQELRNLINDLSADILKDGLVAALQQIVDRFERSYPITVHLNVCYPAALLTPAQEHDLVRIVQEAVSNLCRHSNATTAWIGLHVDTQVDDPALLLTVRDNGAGFDLIHNQSSGWGFKNMRQRAELMGATLDIESSPGAGTTVRLTGVHFNLGARARKHPKES